MKHFIVTSNIALLFCAPCFAQNKISVEIAMGTNYSLNSYNPTEAITTPISKVENKRYFSLNHQITAHYFINNKISIGAGIGKQGFSWGWQPVNHYPVTGGVGISSGGRFFSNDLYYIQASLRYSLIKKKRFSLYHNLAISLLNYTYNDYLRDTAVLNNFFVHPERKEILYKSSPLQERVGIHPLIVYNIGAELNLGKCLYITSKVGTQLGFKWWYKQEVEINRQWEGKSAIYRTRHNGSALTYHVGLGVRI